MSDVFLSCVSLLCFSPVFLSCVSLLCFSTIALAPGSARSLISPMPPNSYGGRRRST